MSKYFPTSNTHEKEIQLLLSVEIKPWPLSPQRTSLCSLYVRGRWNPDFKSSLTFFKPLCIHMITCGSLSSRDHIFYRFQGDITWADVSPPWTLCTLWCSLIHQSRVDWLGFIVLHVQKQAVLQKSPMFAPSLALLNPCIPILDISEIRNIF